MQPFPWVALLVAAVVGGAGLLGVVAWRLVNPPAPISRGRKERKRIDDLASPVKVSLGRPKGGEVPEKPSSVARSARQTAVSDFRDPPSVASLFGPMEKQGLGLKTVGEQLAGHDRLTADVLGKHGLGLKTLGDVFDSSLASGSVARRAPPPALRWYAEMPDRDGRFPRKSLTVEKRSTSLYEIQIEPDERSASVTISENPTMHQRAIENHQRLLLPVCEYLDMPGLADKRILVAKPGRAALEAGVWWVIEKINVRFR